MKAIGNANYRVHLVTAAHKSTLNVKNDEQNKAAALYAVRDRVTISHEARAISRNLPEAVIDRSATPILSYEIRKPFTAPAQRSNITLKLLNT